MSETYRWAVLGSHGRDTPVDVPAGMGAVLRIAAWGTGVRSMTVRLSSLSQHDELWYIGFTVKQMVIPHASHSRLGRRGGSRRLGKHRCRRWERCCRMGRPSPHCVDKRMGTHNRCERGCEPEISKWFACSSLMKRKSGKARLAQVVAPSSQSIANK